MFKYDYWKWEKQLSQKFCNFIIENTNWENKQIAQVGIDENNIINLKDRVTLVVWQHFLSPIGCICQSYLNSANKQAGWNFDVDDIESIQIGKYSDGGHYDWHQDSSIPNDVNKQRKLSISILLNDPSEFDGGNFEFKKNEGENLLTSQGDIIVFPSFLEHRVTPVTSGVRYSAVTWMNGSAFK
jgi:PKHD-type hydroxylase